MHQFIKGARLKKYFLDLKIVLLIYFITISIASVHKYLLPATLERGVVYTKFNNFLIFKSSFYHLLQNKDLYVPHLADHYDLYKYSPTFAFLMFSFAWLPDLPGALIWNLLNGLLLFFAIKALPQLQDKIKVFILWFILFELITSVQNFQSNGLMAALLILGFVAVENKKEMWATLFLVISVYIKLFGLVGFVFFFFSENKKKFILFSVIWFILLGLLPLVVISPEFLLQLYKSWFRLLMTDRGVSYGLSILGVLKSWFHVVSFKIPITILGAVILLLPLFRFHFYGNYNYRLLFLSSLLIWVVIFNHKAESPTYIIAVCGVAIWYFTQKSTTINTILLIFIFVLTCLSSTEIYPHDFQRQFLRPLALKAVPCILVWFKIIYELTMNKFTPTFPERKDHGFLNENASFKIR